MGETNTGRRLGGVLGGVFLLALILGPGPGAGWVDGTAEEPRIWFGVPALYVWVVFWYLVMAGCVVAAAKRLWRDED